MNSIDKLIQLAGVRGNLDLRCRFQGSWAREHDQEPVGVARYHIVLAGVCQAVQPGHAPITLRAGDILMIADGEPHRLQSEGYDDAPSEALVSHGGLLPLHRIGNDEGELDILCGRFLYQRESLLLGALPGFLKVSSAYPQTTDQLSALVGLLRAEADGEQLGARFLIDTLSSALFALIVRNYLHHHAPASGTLALLNDKRLSKAWQAMLDDPAFEWTIDSLAEHASMSRATFMRSFVKVAGESPWALLTRVRMELALRLLSETPHGLIDIACQVGYQSQAAFSKKFKEHYGVSPGRARRASV